MFGSGAQRLSITEFDNVSRRVADAAIVSNGVGFGARSPDEAPVLFCLFSQVVDPCGSFDRKPEMPEIVLSLLVDATPVDYDQYELALLPGL